MRFAFLTYTVHSVVVRNVHRSLVQLPNSTAIIVRAMLDWETLEDYNLTKFTVVKLEDRRKCQAIFTMQRHSTICKLPPMSLTAGRLAIGLNFWYICIVSETKHTCSPSYPCLDSCPRGRERLTPWTTSPFILPGLLHAGTRKSPLIRGLFTFDVAEAMWIPQSKRLCIDMPMYASCTYACAVYFLLFIF